MEPMSGLIENETDEMLELKTIERVEPLLTITPTDDGKRVVMITMLSGVVLVDREWAES